MIVSFQNTFTDSAVSRFRERSQSTSTQSSHIPSGGGVSYVYFCILPVGFGDTPGLKLVNGDGAGMKNRQACRGPRDAGESRTCTATGRVE